jgi:HlyD family secretion protein
MGRFIIGLLVVAAVGTGLWFGYTQYWLPRQQSQAVPRFETVRAERGKIESTVSATGSIQPEAQVQLSFRAPGRVAEVLVAAGQPVQAGDLLATLDTTDLALAMAQAKVTLEISQAQLAKLEAPPSENDIAAAEANIQIARASVAGAEAALASARANLRKLVAGPTETERMINQAQVRQAEVNVRRAQQSYDMVRDAPNIGALPQSAELEGATLALEVARAQAALLDEPADEATLAAARSQIAQAEVSLAQAQGNLITSQNALENLLEGARAEDLAIARAQLRQTQLGHLQAESNLSNAQLIAPINGVVSQVNVRFGEISSAALPDIVLTDLDLYHMKVLVDEIDVRQVTVGQPVRIVVDALAGEELSGVVTEVAPTANDAGGVVAYSVTIVPDASEAPLRPGMSATAIITTAEVDDVVLVPNRYVQLDRSTGQAYVYLMDGVGTPVLHEVALGVRNERASQIVRGLAEGDEIALVSQSSEQQLRGAIFGGR